MEETNWLFDEMFDKVYPDKTDFPELQGYKRIVKEDIMDYYDWIDPYELWYYYMNNYVMRYVNNYYNYEAYNPRVFEKNMSKAMKNYCRTQGEKVVEMCRAEVISISDTIDMYKPIRVFQNGNEGTIKIKYIWRTVNSDACKKCMKLDGKEFNNSKMIHQHWNCRCEIEEVIQILDADGNVLYEYTKIL